VGSDHVEPGVPVGIGSVCALGVQQGIAAGLSADAERSAVEEAIHGVLGWAVEKDFDLLYSIVANDSAYIALTDGRVLRFAGE